jgi:predicted transcriptional regulator
VKNREWLEKFVGSVTEYDDCYYVDVNGSAMDSARPVEVIDELVEDIADVLKASVETVARWANGNVTIEIRKCG